MPTIVAKAAKLPPENPRGRNDTRTSHPGGFAETPDYLLQLIPGLSQLPREDFNKILRRNDVEAITNVRVMRSDEPSINDR